MRVSIVIPSYNQGRYIEQTIVSIITQECPDVEIIVIDGGSHDETLDILEEYSNYISYTVSEPDSGQADALNKGFAIATGDVCGYLNSDDLLLPGALAEICNAFATNPAVDWIVSDILVGTAVQSSVKWKAQISPLEPFLCGQTFGQQGVFWRASVFRKPWFDCRYHFVLDADFFCRLFRSCGVPLLLPVTTAFFRQHQDSKTSTMASVMYDEGISLLEKNSDIFSPKTIDDMKSSLIYSLFLFQQAQLRQDISMDLLIFNRRLIQSLSCLTRQSSPVYLFYSLVVTFKTLVMYSSAKLLLSLKA